ncbi:MAG: hypothetical protein H6Q35_2486 [Proteobacteria bacterium]|nr:hypothetical protein [Pseudomonadota bacterium]MBS1229263.1 hypothetical protein [Pseudomonadota bacterium]
MRIDLSAVPKLCNSPVVPGCGTHRSEREWAAAIADLRPRCMALGYGELCALLREMELGDLTGLVISAPYDAELLGKFQQGLSAVVGEMLAEDCAQHGENLLDADLACGTQARSNAALTSVEARRATPDQLARLLPLARQLAAYSGDLWYREAWLPSAALYPLMTLTGGLDGALGQRIKALASRWEFFVEDYPDCADEPFPRELAEQALSGLPALLAGQPWPFAEADDALGDDELDEWENEMKALLAKIDDQEKKDGE